MRDKYLMKVLREQHMFEKVSPLLNVQLIFFIRSKADQDIEKSKVFFSSRKLCGGYQGMSDANRSEEASPISFTNHSLSRHAL